MKGKIIDILAMKKGGRFPVTYQRITFILEDGSWAKTDVCPRYRNFRFWKSHMFPNEILGNLAWKDAKTGTLDADAAPKRLRADEWTPPPAKAAQIPNPQMALL